MNNNGTTATPTTTSTTTTTTATTTTIIAVGGVADIPRAAGEGEGEDRHANVGANERPVSNGARIRYTFSYIYKMEPLSPPTTLLLLDITSWRNRLWSHITI